MQTRAVSSGQVNRLSARATLAMLIAAFACQACAEREGGREGTEIKG